MSSDTFRWNEVHEDGTNVWLFEAKVCIKWLKLALKLSLYLSL